MFDSITRSLTTAPKILAKFDTRNSFITNSYVQVKGIKVGLNYDNTFKIGLGYSWLKTKMIYQNIEESDLDYRAWVAFAEYVFYHKNHWTVQVPVQLGFAKALAKRQSGTQLAKSRYFVYEPGMTADYRFWRYLSIGGGLGFRLAMKMNGNMEEEFNSPIYILRFKILFGDIYRDHLK